MRPLKGAQRGRASQRRAGMHTSPLPSVIMKVSGPFQPWTCAGCSQSPVSPPGLLSSC